MASAHATTARLALDVAALRARCAEAVVGPGDEGYDRARLSDGPGPAAIGFPLDAGDVACMLAAARDAGLRVGVEATGRGAPRDLTGSLLLRTSALVGTTVDPAARSARVGAGATWEDVDAAASEHRLAAVGACSRRVGVAGFVLGGGVGWLGRSHGLACNHVKAIELVTAGGERARCDHEHDPDLFWALRGGGGGLGVITALELALVPMAQLYAGSLLWPAERAGDVPAAWCELLGTAPRELASMLRMLDVWGEPMLAPPRGRHGLPAIHRRARGPLR
jgi:FAD/FMN-containing dehydrogenase